MFGKILKRSPRYSHLHGDDDDDNSDSSRQPPLNPQKAGSRLLAINTAVFMVSLAIRMAIVFISPQVSRQGCVHDMYLDG
jgi:hypothetical protein